jgi:hypothetical protein
MSDSFTVDPDGLPPIQNAINAVRDSLLCIEFRHLADAAAVGCGSPSGAAALRALGESTFGMVYVAGQSLAADADALAFTAKRYQATETAVTSSFSAGSW